jgi:hypothetical protein
LVCFFLLHERSKSKRNAVNIAPLRDHFGANSLAGVYTTGTGAGEFNRVLAADSRIVFKRLYFLGGTSCSS